VLYVGCSAASCCFVSNSPVDVVCGDVADPSHKALVEERDEAQSQVNFLNSVIVDLQRKNEKLQAQIALLESGVTTAEAEEFNL